MGFNDKPKDNRNRKGNRSPGADVSQSADGKLDTKRIVAGDDRITQKFSGPPNIPQPTTPNFGKINTITVSPTPVVEGSIGQGIVTLISGGAGSGIRAQFRHNYVQEYPGGKPPRKRVTSPWKSFTIPAGGSAAFDINIPINIGSKSFIEVATTFNKRTIDTKEIQITSTDQPVAPSFSSNPTINDVTAASGDTITVGSFTANGNPVPVVTYQWYLNSSAVSGGTYSSYTTTAVGGVSAAVILTNNVGAVSATAEGQVGLVPTFNVSPSASATNVNVGTAVTIDNVAASGTTPITTTYRWTQNGSVIGSATAQTYTTSATGPLSGNVTITNNFGTNNANVDFGSVAAALVAPFFGSPQPSQSPASGQLNVGEVARVLSVFPGGNLTPVITYNWTRSPGAGSLGTSSSYTAVTADQGKDLYVVTTLTNASGATSNSMTFGTVLPQEVAPSFTGSPSASATGATVGDAVSFVGTGATGYPVPSTTYYWTQNDSVIAGATLQSYTTSATGPLSGNVTINNSVGSTGATLSFGTIVPVASGNFAPYFTGSPAGSTTNPDVGERMTFLDYGSTGLPEPSTSFQWYDDGVAISGATGYGYVLGATGELADGEKTYIVTGNGSNFLLDGDSKPVISLTRGVEYIFDQSASSNTGHPLEIRVGATGSDYTSGWTTSGTPGSAGATRTFIVPADAPNSLYYACAVHGQTWGNSINVTTVPATDVTMTGNLTGVVSLSNTQGSTGATIDFGTMLNADITGLSLTNVVAGATLTATVTYGGTYDSIVWTGVTA
jgi:hypothetical protein